MTRVSEERWVFDVEVYPNFFCATFLNISTREKKVFSLFKEKNEIKGLISFMKSDMALIGYNNISYDNIILQYIFKSRRVTPQEIFIFSSKVISLRKGEYDPDIRKLQYAPASYSQIDLMKIIEVNGNVPSLKQVGINLQWPRIQDLPYEFDRPVENWEEANVIISYNMNDVLISEALYNSIYEQIELREKLSTMYNLDLMSCSDSKIGDKLLGKFYTEKTGEENPYYLKGKVKEYEKFTLAECMYPDIHFKTNYMKRVKKEMESAVVRSPNFSFNREIDFGGVKYQIASGGLHSEDFPAKFVTDDKYIIRDVDFASYYPSMMIKNNVVPEHVGKEFREILSDITNERVAAKKNDKVKAAALKITINAIYGKLGFIGSWFRDNKAVLQVTIPGQLYLLMLIERFVLAGIEVISANTDGIVCRIDRRLEKEYFDIANDFSKEIGIGIEFTDYEIYFRRDVNNYITKKLNGETKSKGCYIPDIDMKKGYKYPVVPRAVYEYIVNGTDIKESILSCNNIFDFCTSQKMGGVFQAEFHKDDGTIELLQKTNRFYISNSGGKLIKRHKSKGNEIGLFVGKSVRILNDYDSEAEFDSYDINYGFYIEEAFALIEDSHLYDKEFVPFVDEDEGFLSSENENEKEEFFYKFKGIKGLPDKIVSGLYETLKAFEGDFLDFMILCDSNGSIHSKWSEIIKLNLFSRFGNNKKLLIFFEEFRQGKNKYGSKLSDKSKEKRIATLRELWDSLPNESFSVVEQIKNELSIIGKIQTKFPIDNKYFFVKDVNDEVTTGNRFSPKVTIQSLGTGNSYLVKISKKLYTSFLKYGDIIYCSEQFEKKPAVKKVGKDWVEIPDVFDRWMNTYEKVNSFKL